MLNVGSEGPLFEAAIVVSVLLFEPASLCFTVLIMLDMVVVDWLWIADRSFPKAFRLLVVL